MYKYKVIYNEINHEADQYQDRVIEKDTVVTVNEDTKEAAIKEFENQYPDRYGMEYNCLRVEKI